MPYWGGACHLLCRWVGPEDPYCRASEMRREKTQVAIPASFIPRPACGPCPRRAEQSSYLEDISSDFIHDRGASPVLPDSVARGSERELWVGASFK